MRVCKLLTDAVGAAATYAGTTTAVVAAPSPTVTTFSVTPGGGAALAAADPTGSIVGRAISIGATNQVGIVLTQTTDAIVLSNTLAAAPATSDVVTLPTSYPLKGAKSFAAIPTTHTVDLRGDNTFMDTDSVFQTLEFDVEFAKHNLDVLALLAGGTVVDSGTTPNQKSIWSMLSTPVFSYMRIEARCAASDFVNGDVHIICNKAKAAEVPFPGFVEENYSYPKFKLKGVPPLGTTPWVQVVFAETALAIV